MGNKLLLSRLKIQTGVFILLGLVSHSNLAATIDGIRLWRAPDNTRVVFDMNGPVTHKVSRYSNPERLAIDIPSSNILSSTKSEVARLELENTPIQGIRFGTQSNGDLRVVFDLSTKVNPASFVLKKIDGKPDRLVLDLKDQAVESVKSVEKALGTEPGARRDIIIAIDAGHGGEDPGAVGKGRLYEKDIVFKVAQNLANVVNSHAGYKAYLVRDGDYFIPVRSRPEKARKQKADFFISIHADGFHKSSAHGASVFVLSSKVSSELARRIATQENKSDLIGGVDVIQLDDKDSDVREILVDLSRNRSMAVSADIGSRVLKQLGAVTHLHSKRVESANFGMLRFVDTPSILVETGFITNPAEAKKLNTLAHRTKLSKAIFRGVSSYFNQIPPEGTYVAWKNSGGGLVRHRIARGDTLSAIAKKYKVSIAQIIQENRLPNSNIQIGQTLVIPAI